MIDLKELSTLFGKDVSVFERTHDGDRFWVAHGRLHTNPASELCVSQDGHIKYFSFDPRRDELYMNGSICLLVSPGSYYRMEKIG